MGNNDPIMFERRKLLAAASAAAAAGVVGLGGASAAGAAPRVVGKPIAGSNFGRSAGDKELRQAWKLFCQRLEAAGENLFKSSITPTPVARADAARFLLQNLGQSFDLAFETKNTKYPWIHTFVTPQCKLGGDNADCVYQQAWIDGESVYKISGNKGTARYFSILVHGPRPPVEPDANWRPLMDPFGDVPEAGLFGEDLVTDWKGDFELYVGGPKRGPNWLPTTPVTRKLFIRQYFDDWSEQVARMKIERVDMKDPRPAPMPGDIAEALDWMGVFNLQNSIDWPDWAYEYAADLDSVNINKFPAAKRPGIAPDPAYNKEKDKLRNRSGVAMRWQLAPDEAMILEFKDSDIFWMMTNMGMMLNSMDYLYRTVSWTPSRTKVDPDGMIRFVMTHDDPGYHNWIDTTGLTEGFLENRNMFTIALTDIRTKVVKRSRLQDEMPKGSPTITPEERTAQMWERFHALQDRFVL